MSEGQQSRLTAVTMLDVGDSLWQACVDQLAKDLPEQQFNTWIKPMSAQVSDDFSRVTLFVANRFKLDWVRAQYAGRIAAVLEKLYGQPVQLELAITPREATTRAYPAPAVAANVPVVEAAEPEEEIAPGGFKTRLNTALTFDTLVEGTAN